MIAKLHM